MNGKLQRIQEQESDLLDKYNKKQKKKKRKSDSDPAESCSEMSASNCEKINSDYDTLLTVEESSRKKKKKKRESDDYDCNDFNGTCKKKKSKKSKRTASIDVDCLNDDIVKENEEGCHSFKKKKKKKKDRKQE